MALVLSLFMVLALGLATASSMLIGGAGLLATRNYRGAAQVRFAAEGGISDALQTINAVGVVDFEADVVDAWDNWLGTGTYQFPAGYAYTVAPVADGANPAGAGRLVATATGPGNVRNVVVANVVRSNIPATSPGAIYLARDDPTDATFNGNGFLIDGNDRNYTGGAGPLPAVPGIATRNETNTQEVIASLSTGQKDNIQGQGFSASPLVPSVWTAPAAPTVAQMNQIIDDILARPGVVVRTDTTVNNSGPDLGTPEAPQITHFDVEDGVTIQGNGSLQGAGILIVEGDLTIKGSFNFKGLVLVRGRTNVQNDSDTEVTGNATVYGSLWTQDINLVVGGSAIIQYSSQALGLANNVGGGGALPSPLTVVSLADCGQVPAGAGGCP